MKTTRTKVLNIDNIPDSSGEYFSEGSVSVDDELLPITLSGEVVATAKYELEKDGLYVHIPHIPQLAGHSATPAACGIILGRGGVPVDGTISKGGAITKCIIMSVDLSPLPNQDKRIKPIAFD